VPWDGLLSEDVERRMLQLVRETCVLRHGITSLCPEDANFHPKHLDLDRYHFDEAYHNGDVWTWLSGPVVSAFIKHGLVEAAWAQTEVLKKLVFEEGAAGTLPELRNGIPPDTGENVAGAVSQAWSLAEFLRNFYQDYLGVRPDLLSGVVHVSPVLPPGCLWCSAPVRLGSGRLVVLHHAEPDLARACTRISAGPDAPPLTVRFSGHVPPCSDVQERVGPVEASLSPGATLEFVVEEREGSWVARLAESGELPVCRSELP
jgi:hypothetical protein